MVEDYECGEMFRKAKIKVPLSQIKMARHDNQILQVRVKPMLYVFQCRSWMKAKQLY